MVAPPTVLANVSVMHPGRSLGALVSASTASTITAASSNVADAITATRPARVQRSGSDRCLARSIMTMARASLRLAVRLGLERERRRVDAEALAGGTRTVVEDVGAVAAATEAR